MNIEQYFEESSMQINSSGEDKPALENWKTAFGAIANTDSDPSGVFDCNICLETVKDPVVTLCGHLFCWPCIYKWLHFQNITTEKQDQQLIQQCPVCKAEVSVATLVPLYGKGESETRDPFESKPSHQGLVIPRRPQGPACWFETSRRITYTTPHTVPQFQHEFSSDQSNVYHAQNDGTTANLLNPMTGVFGGMVYARMFSGTITNLYAYPNSYPLVWSSSPRIRRHILQTDESLNRICLFLFCCSILCLLLF